MEKLILLSVSLLFVTMAESQPKRQKQLSRDTALIDLGWDKTRKKVRNGDVIVHKEPGKYDIYASFKKKQVTGYYAIDAKGNKIPATVTRDKDGCFYCIKLPEPDGTFLVLCWWTEPCDSGPMDRSTTKSRG